MKTLLHFCQACHLSLLTWKDIAGWGGQVTFLALSTPEYLCLKMGGIMGHFNVSLIVRVESQDCPSTCREKFQRLGIWRRVSSHQRVLLHQVSYATLKDLLGARHCFPFSTLCLGFCVATLQHELVHLPCNLIFLPAWPGLAMLLCGYPVWTDLG